MNSMEYTFEDWKNGKRCFHESAMPPEYLTVGPTGLIDFNVNVRNTPSWLHDEEGVLSTEEYRKIKEACREVIEAAVDHFKDKIPAHVSKELSEAEDRKAAIDAKISRIKRQLEKIGRKSGPEDAEISDTFPGTVYRDWKNSGNIKAVLKELEDPKATERNSSVTKPYYFNKQLEVALLERERSYLLAQKAELELNRVVIFDKYKEYRRETGSYKEAYERLISWLNITYGFDETKDEKRYGITVTHDALKKQYQRESKGKINS